MLGQHPAIDRDIQARHMMKTLLPIVLLCTTLPMAATPRAVQHSTQGAAPRLVVLLVVDQMRTDYIQTYGHQWTKGLRRLVDTGASFPLAEYPYALTVTCAGHATISTGTLPATHGMIGNGWHDRELRKNVTCTEDASATSVPFGGRAGIEKHSTRYLQTATLADEIRLHAARPSTVVALSLKARSAITLAGHASATTHAVWKEADGTWATSSAYAATASPAIDTWAAANPTSAHYGLTWERLLPESSYLYADDQPAEWGTRLFPHRMISDAGKPDSQFISRLDRSPFGDGALSSLAQHLVRQLKMGQSAQGTDVLAIGFSSLDNVGHAYGPRSHEVQDTLARLDATLGELLDTLDAVVGRDRYVVALSADHGVAPVPEQTAAAFPLGGRYTSTHVRTAIENALTPFFGEGPHVTTVSGANVYLTPGTAAQVTSTAGARQAVHAALATVPGVGPVYWADTFTSATPGTADPLWTLARSSFVAGRSGDLMVMSAPYWLASTSTSNHGAPWDYDRKVPILFAGAGITPGTYWTPASPADIAPTLAALLGITMANVDGRVLTDVMPKR
jgi:predicted AlkP superfamily pyrophosphatase or phosphodiesterase